MLEHIINGGPLMLPLLVCSVLSLAVVFDRAFAFYNHKKIDIRALRARIMELMGKGNFHEAAILCSNTPGPVSAVLLSGIQSYVKHRKLQKSPEHLAMVMEKAMEDYSLHALSAVEKRLNVLSTVGNAAPLLGMTGTVTGMISSFKALSDAGGLDAALVAGGISEALITTAAGLLIALAAVIPFNFFSSLAEKVELEIEEATTEVLDFVATQSEDGN